MAPARRASDSEIAAMKDNVDDIKEMVKAINDALNGKEGLVTKTELNEASIKRIWWFVGGLSFAMVGLCAKIIYAAIIP